MGKTQLVIEYGYLFAAEYDQLWLIDAERPALIGDQLVKLGQRAGWVTADAAPNPAMDAVLDRLRRLDRWLVIFDNAQTVGVIRQFVPTGRGHVLITSRSDRTGGVAVAVGVDVLARAEAVTLLHTYRPDLSDADADQLAAALGDLPLALAQAGALLAETNMPAADYLNGLRGHAQELLDDTPPADYPRSLAATITLSTGRLQAEDPAAVQLLRLCAHLGPEPIPLSWVTTADSGVLPEPLATTATAALAFRRTAGRLHRYALARITETTVQMHRLTQAVLRTDPGDARIQAHQLLAAAKPIDNGADPRSWPAWSLLLPHLLAADPTDVELLRPVACHAVRYLLRRGEYRIAHDLAVSWHQAWSGIAGPDDDNVQWMASQLAEAHRHLGNYEEGRRLNEDILARHRVLGEDHPTPWVRPVGSRPTCACWANTGKPVDSTRTPWPAAADC